MGSDSLGDRMKNKYEDAYRIHLPGRMPVIIRLDGKAFHTFTKHLERPYSPVLMDVMNATTEYLCKNVQNCVLAYTQSDEISLLLVNFLDINTDSWFDNSLQKITSVSASMASAFFTQHSGILFDDGLSRIALFDARAFVVPENDVCNYFVWRQNDWVRNSISMLAQSLYSHKELHGKTQVDQHEMIHAKGKNWADMSSHIKNGRVCIKTPKAFEVTDDLEDAPDGAKIDGMERVGQRWERLTTWTVPINTPIFKEPEGRNLIQTLMESDEQ